MFLQAFSIEVTKQVEEIMALYKEKGSTSAPSGLTDANRPNVPDMDTKPNPDVVGSKAGIGSLVHAGIESHLCLHCCQPVADLESYLQSLATKMKAVEAMQKTVDGVPNRPAQA